MTESERVCEAVYAATRNFYGRIEPRLASAALGFKILYSPPYERPPLMIIGYQPGGGLADDLRDQNEGVRWSWPSYAYFAKENWHIAQMLRFLFGRDVIERSVALNAIFLRSPNSAFYRNRVPPDLRQEVEDFCTGQVKSMVPAISPERIVVVGLNTMTMFGPHTPVLSSTGRTLLSQGKLAGMEAIATIHLTGARPPLTPNELAAIKSHLDGSGLSGPKSRTVRQQEDLMVSDSIRRRKSWSRSGDYAPAAFLDEAIAKGLVIQTVVPNPKAPGSGASARYDLYRVGMTIEQALKAGIRRADLRWDLERDFITLGPP